MKYGGHTTKLHVFTFHSALNYAETFRGYPLTVKAVANEYTFDLMLPVLRHFDNSL